MLGFKKFTCTRVVLNDIELTHMIYKGKWKAMDSSALLPSNFTR